MNMGSFDLALRRAFEHQDFISIADDVSSRAFACTARSVPFEDLFSHHVLLNLWLVLGAVLLSEGGRALFYQDSLIVFSTLTNLHFVAYHLVDINAVLLEQVCDGFRAELELLLDCHECVD